jgi:hypothetical protein
MKQIVTLTVNPAIDESAEAESFGDRKVGRGKRYDPGGVVLMSRVSCRNSAARLSLFIFQAERPARC